MLCTGSPGSGEDLLVVWTGREESIGDLFLCLWGFELVFFT